MKKIFILTGEASGDNLASKVISDLKKINQNIEYLSVGGENLQSIGIKSIYELKEITYLGFTNVFLNIFKIKKKINETVKAIIDYNPDILFTVDSPDFTLRVAEKVKKLNSKIKTVHYVAPQVWVWREGRVKKIKKFIDHILLLFSFEKKYFEKENMSYEFVGHPLLQNKERSKIDINQLIGKNKALISIFAGSRKSEICVLMPILLDFIKLMNIKYTDMTYVFHSTKEYSELIQSYINQSNLSNCEIISDEKIKSHILQKSIFAVAKSGTVSLEICNAKIPSIILYK
ncbi:lipid-A-disaccharide synthase, partial [Candidatus Pelagibacter bacterium]|nr:lipid-A-disaccharide synthase [Candidatus Pelagibacter bacterium]